MNHITPHSVHIPVLGLAYSIDTPVKVAHFGISSVMSIIEDELIEKMRMYYSVKMGRSYIPITNNDEDHRAKRITAYLNLIKQIVIHQTENLRKEAFGKGGDIDKYFAMLPEDIHLKKVYVRMTGMKEGSEKEIMQDYLRSKIVAGSVDVNIMAKADRNNYGKDGTELPLGFSDALAALRGFAQSELRSSLVLSAGYNPRLYNYIEQFPDFFPDAEGQLKKRIILKVSDYRSALIQARLLSKKGVWVSEFRIESGLNCGGHAFATEGYLLGPILQEFKEKRQELFTELYSSVNNALLAKGQAVFTAQPGMRITVQGGIGTAEEHKFLMDHYQMDGTGWGSPFLLVPETTNVDNITLQELATAKQEDYFLSEASPLGVPFNNFRKSTSQDQQLERIGKGRPGSPCYKKYLAFNTEFTEKPICTASREYQNYKLKQLLEEDLPTHEFDQAYQKVIEKECLCEGLGAAVLIKDNINIAHNLSAVAICPGPNLAYFSGIFSLADMISHIYGRINILNSLYRPHMFINELVMYVDYLQKEIRNTVQPASVKQHRYLQNFKTNLMSGIAYYRSLLGQLKQAAVNMEQELNELEQKLLELCLSAPVV
jgi:hypothetical protein